MPPGGAAVQPGQRLDPLMHYAGRVDVKFTAAPASVTGRDLRPFIDHAKQTITSTTGELKLDYGKGVLTLNAVRAQGVSGLLKAAGPVETRDLAISSDMELGHIVAVPLDNQPFVPADSVLGPNVEPVSGTLNDHELGFPTLRIVKLHLLRGHVTCQPQARMAGHNDRVVKRDSSDRPLDAPDTRRVA